MTILSAKAPAMPELPEVETVRRGLAPVMRGGRIDKVELRRADIRFPFPDAFAKRLIGRRIVELSRRAKYLLFKLDSGETLIAHLGMSGSFRVEKTAVSTPGKFHHDRSKDPKHDHVVFVLDNGWIVTYNDPRRFGFMDLGSTGALDQHPRMRDLGAEPLAPEFDAYALAKLFAGARTSLKAGLLDQKRIAGLGNIYVSEALFRAGLSPSKPASVLANARGGPTKAATAVAKAIRDVLEEAVEAGGSTLRDHRQANGELGYFQHVFKVYDREGLPCIRNSCRGIVARITQSGRSTFYCSKCQH
jgi:formamidopyrimidine-DNA glycosylase